MKTVMKNTFMYDQQSFMATVIICMIMINTGLSYRINKFDYADNITLATAACGGIYGLSVSVGNLFSTDYSATV